MPPLHPRPHPYPSRPAPHAPVPRLHVVHPAAWRQLRSRLRVSRPAISRAACARLLIAPLCLTLLAVAYARTPAAPETMAGAANAFLKSLGPEQRAKATFPADADERFNWFYTPVSRKGLPLKEMNATQRQAALALLQAGLSQQGYTKATTIMSIEEVLGAIEGSGPVRDPERYFVSIFGEPSETGVWSYRVEGHHLSQHFTIARGKVAGAPSFFGINPAEVPGGPRKGFRTLPREEDLGRDLVKSLSEAQRKVAIVDGSAPGDILTAMSRVAALNGRASGIQISALNPAQREKLQALLNEYIDNMTGDIAAYRRDQVKQAGNDLWFAWAGGIERGERHYYRIQSAAFLIEYDDTQNQANHIHSVWRDFKGDFGRDLLAAHYQASHGYLARR